MTVRVATDVGGTFTDLVYIDEGNVKAVKSDTTPPNFEQGVVNAAIKADINLSDVDFLLMARLLLSTLLPSEKVLKRV